MQKHPQSTPPSTRICDPVNPPPPKALSACCQSHIVGPQSSSPPCEFDLPTGLGETQTQCPTGLDVHRTLGDSPSSRALSMLDSWPPLDLRKRELVTLKHDPPTALFFQLPPMSVRESLRVAAAMWYCICPSSLTIYKERYPANAHGAGLPKQSTRRTSNAGMVASTILPSFPLHPPLRLHRTPRSSGLT